MPAKYTPNALPDGKPPYVRVLLIGGAGSGKTTLACSLQGHTHILDVDDKVVFMTAELKRRFPQHIITYQTYDTRVEGDTHATVIGMPNQKRPDEGLNPKMKPTLYQDVIDTVNDLSDIAERDGKLPFDTLVLDSWTHLMTHLKAKQMQLHKHAI